MTKCIILCYCILIQIKENFATFATRLQQIHYFIQQRDFTMGTIQERKRKRTGKTSYTATIRMNGQKITQTFDRKTDAKLWINENETQIRKGKHINIELQKHTLNELIERYTKNELPKRKEHDHKKYKMQLDWWSKEIGEMLLANITPAILSECKEKLITENSPKAKTNDKKRTGATANRYMACLSSVFTIACNEWQWLDENPMRKIKKFTEKTYKERFLSDEEIARLLQACKTFKLSRDSYNTETFLFVLIALSTGARYSEIHRLQWKDIDLKNEMFYFLNTKNGDNRGVPMTDDVYKELKAFQKIRNIKSPYLFATKSGDKLIDMHVRFYKVIEDAKIDCRFHDLRHTVASHIAMNQKGGLLDIAQVLGHKTMQTVKRYSHLTQKHTKNILQNTTDEMFNKVNTGME